MLLRCPYCAHPMRARTHSTGNAAGIALALFVLFVGIVISFTGVGLICGLPICLCALFMGGRRTPVWRCSGCRAIIPRG